MKSEFESREAFECIFGDEIDLSKDETGEYSFQPTRFAYSFFLVAWQQRQTEVDELQKRVDESLRILVDIKKKGLIGTQYSIFYLEQALKGGGE